MAISAQIAVYPLRQERLTPAVMAVQEALDDHGLQAEPGPMSTYVVGDGAAMFAALHDGNHLERLPHPRLIHPCRMR